VTEDARRFRIAGIGVQDSDGFEVVFNDRARVRVPWREVPALAAATPEQFAVREVSHFGEEIRWPALGTLLVGRTIRERFRTRRGRNYGTTEAAAIAACLRAGGVYADLARRSLRRHVGGKIYALASAQRLADRLNVSGRQARRLLFEAFGPRAKETTKKLSRRRRSTCRGVPRCGRCGDTGHNARTCEEVSKMNLAVAGWMQRGRVRPAAMEAST